MVIVIRSEVPWLFPLEEGFGEPWFPNEFQSRPLAAATFCL
jgi:hypothetical protein